MSDETEIRKSDGYPERMCPGCGAARREGAAWWYVCGTFWHPPTGQRKVSVKCRDRQLAAAQAERDKAQAACAEWQEAVDAICDRVLNERDAMAEMDFGNDRVNAVLSIIDDVMPCAPLGQPLLDRLAKAEATIAKLPKYADTGKPFVPGVDPSWVVSPKNGVWNPRCDVYFQHGVSDKWGWNEGGFVTGPFYSTEAAALASKEQPHDE